MFNDVFFAAKTGQLYARVAVVQPVAKLLGHTRVVRFSSGRVRYVRIVARNLGSARGSGALERSGHG